MSPEDELGRGFIDAVLGLRRAHLNGDAWARGVVDERMAERLAVGGLAERAAAGLRLRPDGWELAESLAQDAWNATET